MSKDKIIDIMHRMRGTTDPYEMETPPTPDALIRTLKLDVERWKDRTKQQDRDIDFLMPLAGRMAMLYVAIESYESVRDQWDALQVTLKLLAPDLNDLVDETVRGRYIELMREHIEDIPEYQASLPKKLTLDDLED